MAIRVYDEDFSEYIDLPAFSFGESTNLMRGQSITESAEGYLSVTDRGYKNRAFTGLVSEMTEANRWEAEDFFISNNIKGALYRFWIRIPNERRQETWNPERFPLVAGATAGGSPVKAGQSLGGSTITAGIRFPSDYYYLGPLRLRQDGIKITSRFEGIYEMSLSGVVEHAE